MDNIERIHIAKVPYSIEPKAKTELKKYLTDIRARLDADSAEEVIHDIESRIPELLAQRHTKQGDVVTQADIAFIKKQLGDPEQFTAEDDQLHATSGPKKLFRDNDTAMLGGVASGIGKYCSIDANIIRVAFFALAFFYGFGIVLYIFLWLLLPEAKTNADKLLMSGKPVTVSTLQHYQASVNKSLSSGPRVLQRLLRKLFRFISLVFTSLASLSLLTGFGIFSALFYVHPFKNIVSGYGLDYLFLGLVWIGCLAFIGLLILATARIWGHKSSRVNIAAIVLTALLIGTVAGEGASGVLIYNHFAGKYGGQKSIRTLSVSSSMATPKTLDVAASSNLELTYNITNQPLHASYTYYPGMNQPHVSITDSKGVVSVSANQLDQTAPTCLGNICQHIYLPLHVQIYGPGLKAYNNTDGADLTINGNNLGTSVALTTSNTSQTSVNNSNAGTMTISASTESEIDVNNTTAQSANISVDATSNVSGPITNTLNMTLPADCESPIANPGNTILMVPNFPIRATLNGQVQTLADLQQNGCITDNF
jgi:phage shock protein PspC (stress-responsive transcriptional regulator)